MTCVGHTNNIERRIAEHNSGKSKFTRTNKPWKLIFHEKNEDETEARERKIPDDIIRQKTN